MLNKQRLLQAYGTMRTIRVNLSSPQVTVSAEVSAEFPDRAEDFHTMMARLRPAAAINGGYFTAPDGKLMAAAITATGTTFMAGTPVALFAAPLASGLGANKQEYAVSRDGRFLLNQPAEASITSPITLILNWKPKP